MAEGQQNLLIRALRVFYNDTQNCRIFLDTIQSQGSYPSLRILDWLVTNFSKKHNVVFEHNGKEVSVHLAYKQQLRAFSKRAFDPFCRRGRIMFPMPDVRPCPTPPSYSLTSGNNVSIVFPNEARLLPTDFPDTPIHTLVTTTGQLNFFKWIIQSGILDYAVEHRGEIEADMAHSFTTKVKHTRTSPAVIAERTKAAGPSLARPAPVIKKAVCRRPSNTLMSFN